MEVDTVAVSTTPAEGGPLGGSAAPATEAPATTAATTLSPAAFPGPTHSRLSVPLMCSVLAHRHWSTAFWALGIDKF